MAYTTSMSNNTRLSRFNLGGGTGVTTGGMMNNRESSRLSEISSAGSSSRGNEEWDLS